MYLLNCVVLLVGVFGLQVQSVAEPVRTNCPPEGPRVPRPTDLAKSTFLNRATQNITASIRGALNGSIKAGWAINDTSFTLGVVSFESSTPAWQYHHRGAGNVNGTKKVDADSQYHIGSLTKMVTDLIVLKSGIDITAPVTKYLPELRSNSSKIKWNEISISSLSTHLSGIPANYNFSEFYSLKDEWQGLGFPALPPDAYGSCGVDGLNDPCSREDMMKGLLSLDPVSEPNRRPIYSGLGFNILTKALVGYSGKSYEQLLDELIVAPLKLTNTGASPGNDSRAVIPPVENWWGISSGDDVGAGGLYSSLNDLSSIMFSILSRKLMSGTAILEWLKPAAFTASTGRAVGRPFEIYRYFNLTPDHPQSIDVYAKGGSAYGYSSLFSIIDQYGVGLIWLTAGDAMSRSLLLDVVISQVVPALEEEARAQAREQYVKLFTGPATSASKNSSDVVKLNITMDSGPGLLIRNLTNGNHDLLAALPKIYNQTFGKLLGLPTTLYPLYRIFPTDINAFIKTEKDGIYREEWRIKWDTMSDPARYNGSDLPGVGASSDPCSTWLDQDWIHYGGVAINKIIFHRNSRTGKVIGAEVPWLRANLTISK